MKHGTDDAIEFQKMPMVMVDEWHVLIVDSESGFLPVPTSRELSWGKRGYDEIRSARVSCLFT